MQNNSNKRTPTLADLNLNNELSELAMRMTESDDELRPTIKEVSDLIDQLMHENRNSNSD